VTRRLWNASLSRTSPRYAHWHKILGSDDVPIQSLKPFPTKLGDEETQAYSLALDRLTRDQHARLVDFIVDRFGMKGREAVQVLESDGFPIREADVIVSFDLRAFL